MYKSFAIVVTYNGTKWIDKCFGSLLRSTIPLKIIAIDNGSTDGTQNKIRNDFPEVKVIENDKNLGFGKANNLGIKQAFLDGAEYIFLLNQDAWVEKDTIEKLINVSASHPEYGIISPLHLNAMGNAVDYGFSNYIHRDSDHIFLSDLIIKGLNGLNEIYQIDFVNAAFWLLSRKTIETVGGFNPFFFLYGEDNEYVNRCRYFNLKCGFVPSVKGYHGRVQKDSPEKERKVHRTILLVRFLDPNDKLNVDKYINKLILDLLKNLLLLRKNVIKSISSELKYLLINQKEIKKIANMVRSKGPTFLLPGDYD
jgi:N-acetylglucosaminyl-diphospho-decaprenol L-rhamnosyltransferase